MNILVIGGGAWTNTSSLGNTFSNLFENWQDTNFYNLYFRGALPQNDVCENYFSITDIDIVKNFFTPSKIGNRIYKTDMVAVENKVDNVSTKEKNLISYIHKFNLNFIYDIENALWDTNKWKNKKLNAFIKEANPDIVFTFASGNNNIVKSVKYIKEQTNAKIVSFIVDDIVTEYKSYRPYRSARLRKNLAELFSLSDEIFGITDEMCEKYRQEANKEVLLLTKGCKDFAPLKSVYKRPLKMIYAGNLLYGREKTLVTLSKAIENLNGNDKKILLDVYSGTALSADLIDTIEKGGNCSFKGECPYDEVVENMKNADIVLHIESFVPENIEKVRYSFSTKITDCLQSGNLIFVIGPKNIAVEHKFYISLQATF